MSNLGKIVCLTETQLTTLIHDGSITVGGQTVTYSENDIYMTPSQPNIPAGGNTGDVLTKINALDYNTAWTPPFTPLDAYPIGSIYMSVTSTDPGTIFGGTWVTFGAGRVLVGVDANDTDFDTVEETGGEKTHTLTTDEMAAHTHGNKSITGTITPLCWSSNGGTGIVSVTSRNANKKDPGSGSNFGGTTLSINASHEHSSVGSDQAHNNLQPYITCYMWKRTA